ncbi:hypothetical protein [Arenibacter certesii]|uniref:Uncharacterized protein n=1 Tax=Arenibacter certesii TaxID=228955 RepID=A0A918J217_9FLAO|nr:hypothetical protein [Arenibacter certesii]GGW39232.1 hypothetical protein GCM10007383_24950 [Arenibacter certesii]
MNSTSIGFYLDTTKTNVVTMGQVMLPFEMYFPKNHGENELRISKALSERNTFDKEITFKEKDRLQIVFNNNSESIEEVMEFEFE